MEMDNSLLQQIATDVLTGMLGLKIAPSSSRSAETTGLMASIRISGDWQAGLEVLTPVRGARTIAAQMFGTPDEELLEEEIADALGEIANMIGGNLKGLSQGETMLSLPCVGPSSGTLMNLEQKTPMEVHLRMGTETISLRLQQSINSCVVTG